MRIQTTTFLLAALVPAVLGAASTQIRQPAAEPGAGTTTYTRGNEIVRAETTLASETERPAPGVTLTLDRETYTPGAMATMKIANNTADPLGYNPCSNRVVETRIRDAWVVHSELNRMCTMELRIVNPRETATATTDIPEGLAPGLHRIVLTLRPQRGESGGTPAPVRAISPAFSVEAGASR